MGTRFSQVSSNKYFFCLSKRKIMHKNVLYGTWLVLKLQDCRIIQLLLKTKSPRMLKYEHGNNFWSQLIVTNRKAMGTSVFCGSGPDGK